MGIRNISCNACPQSTNLKVGHGTGMGTAAQSDDLVTNVTTLTYLKKDVLNYAMPSISPLGISDPRAEAID